MKHLVLFFFALTFSLQVLAQPAGYYNGANGLTGEPLKAALNDIIDGHTAYSYSALWDLLQVTDADPNNPGNVIGFYSRFSMNGAAGYANGSGWNREHVWAKSKGGFGTSTGAGTDLHHMRASDITTNGARNNRLFADGGSTYTDAGGNYYGTTPCKEGSAWSWEPGADQKGDVARMIFYMATRYEGENGEVDLELTEELLASNDQRPLHGKLSTLLAWHTADPVSAEEINRNELVYGYQNNRNPYIDHPEYVDAIWGGTYVPGEETPAEEPPVEDTIPPSTSGGVILISEYVEGSSYNKAIEITNYSTESVNLSAYQIKKQVNGSGAWSTGTNLTGTLASGAVFVISHVNADAALLAVADMTSNGSEINFNGNDPIGLFYNGTLVDVVGTFNGGSANFGANQTLRRKSSVVDANTTYTTSEWDFYASNTFSNVGVLNGSSSMTINNNSEMSNEGLTVNTYTTTNNQIVVGTDATEETIVSVQVYSMTGQMMINESIQMNANENFNFDTTGWNAGVYIIHHTAEGKMGMNKVRI